MSETKISEMVEAAIQKIKEMTTTDTVVGQPIKLPNGATAVPVCKVCFGFGSGGADLPAKGSGELFGGGIGSGVTITPVAFLVERGSKVELLQLNTIGTTADRIVGAVPEVMDKVSDMVAGFKSK
ncbi:MAG: spore germination protein GerW family protein [Oscillospiraceae bacterium]|nr:spore germination protein GerW family protein [Oscillospiraceae bacterium]